MVQATWDNLIEIVKIQFPELKADLLKAQIEELKKMSFDEIHAMADFDFEEVKRIGRHHPQYYTAERLNESPGTIFNCLKARQNHKFYQN
jgi:hypothetical protein